MCLRPDAVSGVLAGARHGILNSAARESQSIKWRLCGNRIGGSLCARAVIAIQRLHLVARITLLIRGSYRSAQWKVAFLSDHGLWTPCSHQTLGIRFADQLVFKRR